MRSYNLSESQKKAKSENRTAFRLRFMSCERCLLCCGIGREGTLFPPFLLFLFLQFLLGLHFLQNLFQRLDRFRFLTLEPLEIDVLYKLWKRHFPRFRSGLESSSSQVLKSIFSVPQSFDGYELGTFFKGHLASLVGIVSAFIFSSKIPFYFYKHKLLKINLLRLGRVGLG